MLSNQENLLCCVTGKTYQKKKKEGSQARGNGWFTGEGQERADVDNLYCVLNGPMLVPDDPISKMRRAGDSFCECWWLVHLPYHTSAAGMQPSR